MQPTINPENTTAAPNTEAALRNEHMMLVAVNTSPPTYYAGEDEYMENRLNAKLWDERKEICCRVTLECQDGIVNHMTSENFSDQRVSDVLKAITLAADQALTADPEWHGEMIVIAGKKHGEVIWSHTNPGDPLCEEVLAIISRLHHGHHAAFWYEHQIWNEWKRLPQQMKSEWSRYEPAHAKLCAGTAPTPTRSIEVALPAKPLSLLMEGGLMPCFAEEFNQAAADEFTEALHGVEIIRRGKGQSVKLILTLPEAKALRSEAENEADEEVEPGLTGIALIRYRQSMALCETRLRAAIAKAA